MPPAPSDDTISYAPIRVPAVNATGSAILSDCAGTAGDDQLAQRVQVLLVQRIDRDRPRRLALGFRRLQQHRQILEAAIVDDAPERLEPEVPVADVLMTIDAAAERFLRVVHVKRLQPLEPDD